MADNHEINSGCEQRFSNIEDKVLDIGAIREAVIVIKEYIISAKEESKKRDEREEKLTEAINSMNTNMTILNHELKNVSIRVGDIELKEQKKEEATSREAERNKNEKGKIDVVGLLQKAVETLIIGGIIYAITYGINNM